MLTYAAFFVLGALAVNRDRGLMPLFLSYWAVITGWPILYDAYPDIGNWYLFCALGEVVIILFCLQLRCEVSTAIARISCVCLSVHLFTMADVIGGSGWFYNNYSSIIKASEAIQCLVFARPIKTIRAALEWTRTLYT